jgi:tRNA dimethylallyltransferase
MGLKSRGTTSAAVNKPSIVVICGPTASGKSLLGLELAGALGGEIVSADSMQVYVHMDIGTDKPLPETRAQVKHHAIDLVYPDQPFDAARYRDVAFQAIKTITNSKKRALVVGGTGLYVRALTRGLFRCPPIPEEIRVELKEEAQQRSVSDFYEELKRVDAVAACRIHPRDSFRIVRALEVYRGTGKAISELQRAQESLREPYRILMLAVEVDRTELYHRIDLRVDRMI